MESKKRILIADADVVFRDALIEALSEEGDMEVVGTTDDGERAVELVRSCKPDILVMDLILSHMDGLDVLAALDAACLTLCPPCSPVWAAWPTRCSPPWPEAVPRSWPWPGAPTIA